MRKRTWQEIKDEAPWKQTEALKTRMEPPAALLKPSSKSSSAKLKPPEGSPDNQIQIDNSVDDNQPGEGDLEEFGLGKMVMLTFTTC